ncbi:MAG TPA: phosphatidate cytidylyltransferase [Acidimicrobiales bacterium]|jgi:CDP-diglyceride synthetase|nr:phosphatidate cytidylyltransferase [Acidimicrobiales bacterium]
MALPMEGNIDVTDGDDRREDEDDEVEEIRRRIAERSGPSTDQVRIVGAEVAGEATAVVPVVSRDDLFGESLETSEPPKFAEVTEPPEAAETAVHLTNEPIDPSTLGHTVKPVQPGETAVPMGTPAGSATKLPHWTEAPTGQVPAVLNRDTGAGSGSHSGIAAPSWREDDSDWLAHDEEFEPSMFGDDEAALGSLDETNSTDVDRRPWEFDLPSSETPAGGRARRASGSTRDKARGTGSGAVPAAGVTPEAAIENQLTTQVPAVPRSDPADSGSSQDGDGSRSPGTAGGERGGRLPSSRTTGGLESPIGPDEPEEVIDDLPGIQRTRPTGSARVGRMRRGGMRSDPVKAKRPEEMDALIDPPLAAEPPGASVTAVPGAGRRRGGLAGLAAADSATQRSGRLGRRLRGEDGAHQDPEFDGEPDLTAEAYARSHPYPDTAAGAATTVTPAVDPYGQPDLSSPADTETTSRRGGGDTATYGDDLDQPAYEPSDGDGPLGGGPPVRRMHMPSRRGRDDAEGGASIQTRVITGIIAAAVGLLVFKLGPAPALVLCVVVVTFAAGECFGVMRRAGYHPATLLGLVGTVSLMIAAYTKGPAAIPLVLVLIAVFTMLWYLFGIERGSPVAGSASTLFTMAWIALLGSYSALLLSPSQFPHRTGIAFLLGAVIATVANDIGALVIGGWIGRHALAPNVSPHKTWEGFLGGAVFSVVISAALVGDIHPWTPAHAALLGVVVAVVAPIGDLCESLLKRDFRIKDMGSILPGHGGVLDRIDALLFVLPATYYLVRALNIG